MQISNESKLLELEYEINAQEFGPPNVHTSNFSNLDKGLSL
jgi:hypothetical protein